MERIDNCYTFTDDELHTLQRAMALYAGYTTEMEVGMLVGDESDVETVAANHNRAQRMFRQFFEDDEGVSFDKARERHSEIIGRPADINDFSDFDWYQYVQGELNK